MKALDHHFHRAQNLLRGNTLSRQPATQTAAAPIFYQLTPGDGAMYDVPAYIRNRIQQFDYANQRRAADYADRVRMMLRSAA